MIHREGRRLVRESGGEEGGGRVEERDTYTHTAPLVVDIIHRIGTGKEGYMRCGLFKSCGGIDCPVSVSLNERPSLGGGIITHDSGLGPRDRDTQHSWMYKH